MWEATMEISNRPTPGGDTTEWVNAVRGTHTGRGTEPNYAWETCLLTTWFIWKARCKAEFDGEHPNPEVIVEGIRRAKPEHPRRRHENHNLRTRPNHKWERPENGTTKRNLAGIGIVA